MPRHVPSLLQTLAVLAVLAGIALTLRPGPALIVGGGVVLVLGVLLEVATAYRRATGRRNGGA